MIKAIKHVFKWFMRLEDEIRSHLSHYPVIYSLISGFAIVIFWKGIWDTAAMYPSLTGPILIAISLPILLVTGLFVSFFVTDKVLLTGLKKDEKIIKETETEMRQEEKIIYELAAEVHEIGREVHDIEEKLRMQK